LHEHRIRSMTKAIGHAACPLAPDGPQANREIARGSNELILLQHTYKHYRSTVMQMQRHALDEKAHSTTAALVKRSMRRQPRVVMAIKRYKAS